LIPKERTLYNALYVTYKSPYAFGSKDIAQVKVVQNKVKVQNQGQ
jgi:hypothetical protein